MSEISFKWDLDSGRQIEVIVEGGPIFPSELSSGHTTDELKFGFIIDPSVCDPALLSEIQKDFTRIEEWALTYWIDHMRSVAAEAC